MKELWCIGPAGTQRRRISDLERASYAEFYKHIEALLNDGFVEVQVTTASDLSETFWHNPR